MSVSRETIGTMTNGLSILTRGDMEQLRQRAWRETGIAIIPISEIRDQALRDAIARECNRLYGSRISR